MLLFFNGPQHQHHHHPQPHPVTWKVSNDGSILIGHMILNKSFRNEPFVGSSATMLGIRVVGGQITEAGTIGAVIEKVKKGSIADTIGKLCPGDEILEWNGRSLQGLTFEEVYDIIAESRHEPQIELIVCRVNIRPVQQPLHMSPCGTGSPHHHHHQHYHPDHRSSRLSTASPTSWGPKTTGLNMISVKRQLPQVPMSRTGAGSGHSQHWDHVMSATSAVGAFDALTMERTSSGGSLPPHRHAGQRHPHLHPRLPALPLPASQPHAFPHHRRVSQFARTVSAGEWMTQPAIYSDSEISARPSYSSDKVFYAHPIQRPSSAAGRQRSRARSSAPRTLFTPEEPEYPPTRVLMAEDTGSASGRKSREDLRRESLEFVPRHSRREVASVITSERRDTLRFEAAAEEENVSETSSQVSEEKGVAMAASSSSMTRTTQVKHHQQPSHHQTSSHHHPATLSSTASLGYDVPLSFPCSFLPPVRRTHPVARADSSPAAVRCNSRKGEYFWRGVLPEAGV